MTELQVLNKKPKLPRIKHGEYLLNYLSEIGYTTGSGDSYNALTFTEIKSWIQISGISVTYDEALHIKRLSETFVNALRESSRKGATPYYTEGDSNISGRLKDAFSVLRKK